MALDLIDKMLTVDAEQRITIDECLEHPWTTERILDPADSTEGLTGALGNLDFSKRKVRRERTLLSSFNDVRVSHVVPIHPEGPGLKVFSKNPGKPTKASHAKNKNKQAQGGRAEDFMHLGTNAKDQPLFLDDQRSQYAPETQT